MRKDKLYLLTFISISVIFLIIASVGVKYFIKVSANQLIELQLESSKRESNEISKLINYQLGKDLDKENVIKNIQLTIENTQKEASFISVFNWSGKAVCHPNITQVGQKVNSNQSLLNSLKEENSSDQLYDLLINQKKPSKDSNTNLSSEIIHISPVLNSDLIIAAHINLDKLSIEISKLKKSFYTIFILMGVLIIFSSFLAVRIIGSYYEKQLELKNSNLESELINLSKLNADLVDYQQKVVENNTQPSIKESIEENNEEAISDSGKKRILTYIRNELVPIHISEISYIYTEDTITYVITSNDKKSTTNASLDELLANLDASLFFRANRQFIISITSIKKIIKYGNSQLKILIQDTDVEIIISKNKASEFRQWLNI
ncbi:LytTR family DNA-binding domain-containing protein [Flavivirga jejuensis]|uniref:LytTR family DNA-binding domain-containing protein n=1 Tax=Flavivirga jejuensis TaxID=870487 RepID=A0ABT8WQQ2_9FLAO|nr:LytTR family DNA-binding domain-containing protein [Flavivirga jejuensis]MDO5975473.1 LytTR family DNA-binding domain-containing protein [Flavivirga jejuensis]